MQYQHFITEKSEYPCLIRLWQEFSWESFMLAFSIAAYGAHIFWFPCQFFYEHKRTQNVGKSASSVPASVWIFASKSSLIATNPWSLILWPFSWSPRDDEGHCGTNHIHQGQDDRKVESDKAFTQSQYKRESACALSNFLETENSDLFHVRSY